MLEEIPDVRKSKRYSNYGFKLLAMAVVKQAAKDGAESFFKSERFKMFMPEYDGEVLWKQIKLNYENTGKWYSGNYEDIDI